MADEVAIDEVLPIESPRNSKENDLVVKKKKKTGKKMKKRQKSKEEKEEQHNQGDLNAGDKKEKKKKKAKRPLLAWRPTSAGLLEESEKRMLDKLKTPYEQVHVEVGKKQTINTLIMGDGPPLVLIHGFGCAVGFWIGNLDYIAEHHKVYAIDMIGFGRSSRPNRKMKTAEAAEDFFIEYLLKWRKAVGLKKFILAGHSMGSFISGCFTMRYPKYVEKLIFIDAWGIAEAPPEDTFQASGQWKMIRMGLKRMNTLAPLRGAGPWGRKVVIKLRPDIPLKFRHLFPDETYVMREVKKRSIASETKVDEGAEDPSTAESTQKKKKKKMKKKKMETVMERVQQPPPTVVDYLYHINAQTPATGERAFRRLLSYDPSWTVNPLCNRLPVIEPDIPVYFIYGSHTWMDVDVAYALQRVLKNDVKIGIVYGAGHHVFIDQWEAFNEMFVQMSTGKFVEKPEDKQAREEPESRSEEFMIIEREEGESSSSSDNDLGDETNEKENGNGNVVVDDEGWEVLDVEAMKRI